eukprot:SAG31_NODE_8991_length_1351_cov_1.366613_2_plen_227_part_01
MQMADALCGSPGAEDGPVALAGQDANTEPASEHTARGVDLSAAVESSQDAQENLVPIPPAGDAKSTKHGRNLTSDAIARPMPKINDDDIILSEHGSAELGAHNTIQRGGANDEMVATEKANFVYVQHPITGALSKKQQSKWDKEQEKKEQEKKEQKEQQLVSDGVSSVEEIHAVLASAFVFVQAIMAGMATLLLFSVVWCSTMVRRCNLLLCVCVCVCVSSVTLPL